MGETWNRIQLNLQPDLVKQIDDWRRHQADLPNRNEAIRRLVILGLGVKDQGQEK